MRKETIPGLEDLENLERFEDLSIETWALIAALYAELSNNFAPTPEQAAAYFITSCVEAVLNGEIGASNEIWALRISQMRNFWGVLSEAEREGVTVGIRFLQYIAAAVGLLATVIPTMIVGNSRNTTKHEKNISKRTNGQLFKRVGVRTFKR